MKKIISVTLCILLMITMLTACESDSSQSKSPAGDIDVDLTQLSSTMVYSEVYNMVMTPEDYEGKIVKMRGAFAVYEEPLTGEVFFACIISDATACCSQGLEFVLAGDYKYPEDYPDPDSEITVTGVFGTYEDDSGLYYRLNNARLG